MREYTKLFTILLIFVLLFSNIACAVNLKDVPENHWAYKSVQKLVEEGYLTLYDDNTFNGEKSVSRYELAVMIARILDNISRGKKQVDGEDVDTIRKLSLEFRDELVEIAQTQDVFSDSLTEIEKKINIMENEDIPQIYEKTNRMEEQITANEKEIENIIDTIIRIKTLEEEIAGLQSQITSMKEEITETGLKVEEKEKLIEELRGNVNKDLKQQLEDQHTVTLTRIQSLENRVSELENQLAVNKDTGEEPEKQEDNTALYLGAAALIILLAGMN